MEAGVAGLLYGIETAAEDAIAFAKAMTNPTAPLKATFKRLKAPSIPRSSHTISVIYGRAYIFGGEFSPREPVDNAMHMIILPSTDLTEADYESISPRSSTSDGALPAPRVGHSAAVIEKCIYIFGGRGGPSMTALEEKGRVWVFDTTTNTWSYLDPEPGSPYPEARSYHASTASIQPMPDVPRNIANVLLDEPADTTEGVPEPVATSTYGTLFVHAGCLSSGRRESDLWTFDLSSRSWSTLPSAPGPPRGGTSLVLVRDRLYRFGGFDGKHEQGGQIDFLDLNVSSTFDDKGGRGFMALSPRGGWRSNLFTPESNKDSKGGNKTYPANRSVCGLASVTTGQGREYLLVLCGEGEASTQGHAGAGRFFDDVFGFQLKPMGWTAASLKDATREVLMKKDTGEAECVEVQYFDGSAGPDKDGASLGAGGGRLIQESQDKPMGRRGWIACSPCEDAGSGSSVLVWGGMGEDNERLGDGWIVTVE